VSDRINAGIFSSNVDRWETPASFMAVLREEFDFDLDPCALPSSAKAPIYFTPTDDGLRHRWHGTVFMNPPYGRGIGDWVAKARTEARLGATVVALIPARTDTGYWHEHVMEAATEVRFIRGRLHFGGDHERTAHNAPFPSALVIFTPTGGPPTLSSIKRAA
jgi:phage N-6-adenine-methyltransferase